MNNLLKQIGLTIPAVRRALSDRDEARLQRDQLAFRLSQLTDERDKVLSELHERRVGDRIVHETDAVARRLAESDLLFDTTPTLYNGIKQPSPFGLPELGEQYLPTKRMHNYLLRYDHVFGEARHRFKRVVEIGVQTDKSVRMWRDYFPNAEIVGIDIDPDCKRLEGERIKIVIGDQTDRDFLVQFAKDNFGQIDAIIDDGLHTPDAIQASFECLYPALSSHGIYAIEDLVDHSYVPSLVSAITAAINHWPKNTHGKFWPILDDLGPDADWFARHTIGVEFYRYILFVKRGINPRDNPFIMDKSEYYRVVNGNLNAVADAKKLLVSQGREVNAENLVEIVGFQLRTYVHDYLSGISNYEFDEAAKDYRATR